MIWVSWLAQSKRFLIQGNRGIDGTITFFDLRVDSKSVGQISQSRCTVRVITATIIKRKAQLLCGCVVV
jgi:hypothetical protein